MSKVILLSMVCFLGVAVVAGCAAGDDPTENEGPNITDPNNPENPPDNPPPEDPPPDDPILDPPDDPPPDDPPPDDPPVVNPPGGSCMCDNECEWVGGQEGICVFGVCMVRASASCSAAGSSAECPDHLRCWGLQNYEGSICWPDCDTYACVGGCDGDGSCVPNSGMDCDMSCGSYCTGTDTPPDTPPGTSPIGGECTSPATCADMDASCYTDTGFVGGYCLIFGCPTPGAACGTGGICVEGLTDSGDNVCMGDCAAGCRAGYFCYESFCWPGCASVSDCPAGHICEGGVCIEGTACTPGSCPTGETCIDGRCVPDISDGPGPYTGITCDLPALECTGGEAYCSELIQFDPTEGVGYIDYPENGETWTNQYRSWLRRDAVMLIQYATAKVACMAAEWTFGNGMPLGLIDMSEEDGSIPGTSDGSPGHPPGTHTNGFDIDVAYYQNGTADNMARPICDHYSGGAEAYHCTAPPHLLDPWRTALFLGALFEHPNLRVVGCDGEAGPILDAAIENLCASGWLTSYACSNRALTYETTDMGYGWYYFHHHHMHISFSNPYRRLMEETAQQCLIPGCSEDQLLRFLEQFGLPK